LNRSETGLAALGEAGADIARFLFGEQAETGAIEHMPLEEVIGAMILLARASTSCALP
jgi:hypothetical protein